MNEVQTQQNIKIGISWLTQGSHLLLASPIWISLASLALVASSAAITFIPKVGYLMLMVIFPAMLAAAFVTIHSSSTQSPLREAAKAIGTNIKALIALGCTNAVVQVLIANGLDMLPGPIMTEEWAGVMHDMLRNPSRLVGLYRWMGPKLIGGAALVIIVGIITLYSTLTVVNGNRDALTGTQEALAALKRNWLSVAAMVLLTTLYVAAVAYVISAWWLVLTPLILATIYTSSMAVVMPAAPISVDCPGLASPSNMPLATQQVRPSALLRKYLLTTKSAIAIAVLLVIGGVAAYFRVQMLKDNLEAYIKLEVKEIPNGIIDAYGALDVRRIREMPGFGIAFGGNQARELLRELGEKEDRAFGSFGASYLKWLLAKPVVKCAEQINKARNKELDTAWAITKDERMLDFRKLDAGLNGVDLNIAMDCLVQFKTHYPTETKTPEANSTASQNRLPLPDVKKLTEEAERGNSSAMLELAVYYEGNLYKNKPDLQLAHKWYLEAAKQDNYLAHLSLASLYQNGAGVQASVIDAYSWYQIAKLCLQKHGRPQAIPAAETQFMAKFTPTAAQMEEGSKRAAQWRAQQFGEPTQGPIQAASPEPEKLDASATSSEPTQQTSSVSRLIESMLNAARTGSMTSVIAAREELDKLPKSARGDRKVARDKNKVGLSALNAGNYKSAIEQFKGGVAADPSDIEVINNLGYALMMDGQLEAARAELINTLALDCSRGGAWANLGQVYAKKGDQDNAVAAFKLTYYFSRAPEKTVEFFTKMAEGDSDNAIRTAARSALSAFSSVVRPEPAISATIPASGLVRSTPQAPAAPAQVERPQPSNKPPPKADSTDKMDKQMEQFAGQVFDTLRKNMDKGGK